MPTLSGRRGGFGRLLTITLAFASPALSNSVHHARNHHLAAQKRSPGDANVLDLDVAAVFPQNHKRQLGGLVNVVVNGVTNIVQPVVVALAGGGVTTVLTTTPVPTIALPTSSSSVVNNPAPVPSSSANGGGASSSSSNSQAVPSQATPAGDSSQNPATSTNPIGKSSTTIGGYVQ